MERQADGSIWVSPRPELLMATNVDGRLLVRIGADGAPSDITDALDWVVDIDWADLTPTPQGATFTGVLRATNIAPADDSPPAICVSDVGGFSRTVGLLHYTGEPTIEGLDWTAPVAGVIETDPLVATTDLARAALALHVGFRGLLVPIGGLWTHGRRAPMHLTCPRGDGHAAALAGWPGAGRPGQGVPGPDLGRHPSGSHAVAEEPTRQPQPAPPAPRDLGARSSCSDPPPPPAPRCSGGRDHPGDPAQPGR